MNKQTMSKISIIPLVLGSILLFAAGSGLISEKYPLMIGSACFLIFVIIEGLSWKKINPTTTDDQRWKSHQKISYEEKKSSVA